MSELSGRQQIIDSYKVILLFLDGIPIEMPVNLIYERPKLSGKLWVEWSFLVTSDLATRLARAEKIGSGVSPAAHIFSGFSGMGLGAGKNKMLELFDQCKSTIQDYSKNSKTSTVTPSSSADIALATRLARNLDREFRKGGMLRLRQSVEDCYKTVRLHPIASSVEYCYILDQISCGLDESFWENIGKSQPDAYWKKESGTARTLAVLTSVKTNADSYDDALSQWQMTKNAALSVMLSMRH
jgi:hypothetical protein